jgi:hypothetical protein
MTWHLPLKMPRQFVKFDCKISCVFSITLTKITFPEWTEELN